MKNYKQIYVKYSDLTQENFHRNHFIRTTNLITFFHSYEKTNNL